MQKQILVRKPMAHGNVNRLLRCNVLSEANGKIRCQCEGDRQPIEVDASQAIPASTVFGPGSRPVVMTKSYPEAHTALGNMKLL